MSFLEIWSIVRLFLSKFGREAYAIAKELASDVASQPGFFKWTDDQRRDYVVKALTERLQDRYGHIPGFSWVIQLSVQLAVGWVRKQLKASP